jgi:hypothetical protein
METVDADGRVIGSVEFSDTGAEVVAFVEEAAGTAPELTSVEPAGGCGSAASAAAWGSGFTLTYDIEAVTPTGFQMVVDVGEPALPNGVRVQTPTGFAVGDSVAELEASLSGVYTEQHGEGEAYRAVHYDVGFGAPAPLGVLQDDPSSYWGAVASAIDGRTITALTAPRTYVDTC